MLKHYCQCILILFVIGFSNAWSQPKQPNDLPRSFTYSSQTKPLSFEIQTITTLVPNVDSVESLERTLDSLGVIRPFRFGISIPVSISNHTHGTLDELDDSSFIWRLKVICPGAKSINFEYNTTSLPRGSYLYAYNSDQSSLEGPWYDKNTRPGKKLGTFPVKGNSVIIEVYIPRSMVNEVTVDLGKIIYGFREMESTVNPSLAKYKDGDMILSGNCHKDVNCSEGDAWCRQKYSISRILINYSSICTGSLLNNTNENYKPYFLTAFHCLDNNLDYTSPSHNGTLSLDEKNQVEDWSFQFGFMREGCSNGIVWNGYSYSGSVFRSAWNTTDFALLELEQQPVSGEEGSNADFLDVYFNGWDRSGNIPNNTACIHHPGGDVMKISVDNDAPDINGPTCTDNNDDTYWRVYWNVGATEGTSSGSPLFDHNHRTIGQLRGGGSSCLKPGECDQYGRLSKSWTGGGSDDTRLGNWLDPITFDENNLSASPTVLNGIKLDRLDYGKEYQDIHTLFAYDKLIIGSRESGNDVDIWSVFDDAIMDAKSERVIQIKPCSWIRSGAEARFHIGSVSCSDIVTKSDNESDYMACTSGSAYFEPREKRTEQDIPLSDTPNYVIRIIPNPATDEIQIIGAITAPVELFSSVGLSVMTIEKGVRKVDVSQLTSGMYYARIPTVAGVVVKSFMIIR